MYMYVNKQTINNSHHRVRKTASYSANSDDQYRKYMHIYRSPISSDHTKSQHVRLQEGSCCDLLWKHKEVVFVQK
jgi:hypothetical protein